VGAIAELPLLSQHSSSARRGSAHLGEAPVLPLMVPHSTLRGSGVDVCPPLSLLVCAPGVSGSVPDGHLMGT